jgi:hypothetical protein
MTDWRTIVGGVLLLAWAVATWATEAPGWVHGLLTAGVCCVVWGVARPRVR